jgi:general secretion pathway protein A
MSDGDRRGDLERVSNHVERSGPLETGSAPPAPSPWTTASLTYEPHFGFREKPFSLSADPRFLFRSTSHTPALDELAAGIRRREGLIVLTGDIGTGKTTLCRAVLNQLDRRTFSTFVPDPFVSREDLLRMLLIDFGVMSVADLKSGRLKDASRSELSYLLYEFLHSLVPLQAFAVLVIDEAQNLPLPLLEEIRILSELESDREKLLQVVLVGQPELRAHLKLPEMRQVDQRVTVRCELAPLGRAAVTGYVSHRLHIATGGTCTSVHFTTEALDEVYRVSSGTPRVINLVCDRALHEAWVNGVHRIDSAVIAAAIARLGLVDPPEIAERREEPPVATADPVEDPSASFEPAAPPPEHPLTPPSMPEALAEFASESSMARPRRYSTFVLALMCLVSASMGAVSWYLIATRGVLVANALRPRLPAHVRPAIGAAADRPEVPAALHPAAPGQSRAFVIQVASFESTVRAARLVNELTRAGYRAYPLDADPDPVRGPLVQVLAGPYTTLAEAEADLLRIQRIPGYADATIRGTIATPQADGVNGLADQALPQ